MASKGQRGGNRPCLRSPVLLLFASCLLVFTLLTISPVRHPVAQASWEVISRHGKALITPFTPHIEQQHDDLYRPHSAPDVPTTSSPSLPSTDYPLKSFLADRLEQPGTKRPEKLWLTVADGRYIDQVLSHLTTFLGKLNAHSSSHHHELLILCLDADCISSSAKRGWLAYGGYAEESWPDRGPQGMGKVQWVKTRGMGDVLQAGYAALFVDGDVFFRANPFEQGLFLPLSDKSWDVQVQDEGHKNQLNIGVVFMRSSTAWVWREVADRLQQQGGWDQDHFNAVLDSVIRRQSPSGATLMHYEAPQGLRVRILPPRLAWGFHFGWMFPQESVLLHMTCSGTVLHDKLYLAGTYGALQDVEDYYSDPPRILTVSTLAGDREDLALTLHILLAASHATNRSFLPPLMGTYLGPTDIDDGIVRGPDFTSISVDSNGDPPHPTTDPLVLHRRFFWSLFRPSVLEAAYQGLRVLEPNFLTHSIRTLLDRGEIERAKELNEVAILDLRPVFSFEMLVEKLREPLFARARVVRISTDEGPRGFWSRYQGWEIPREAGPRIEPCWQIEKTPACSTLCREPPGGWL